MSSLCIVLKFSKKDYALYPTIGFFTVHGQYGHKEDLPFLDFLLLNVMEFLWKSDVVLCLSDF